MTGKKSIKSRPRQSPTELDHAELTASEQMKPTDGQETKALQIKVLQAASSR